MDNYLIYFSVAVITILLPGPAVMLTISNSIQRGLLKTFAGIFGIALAILLVAIVSATSLGVVLANSALAFNIIKIFGAIYLVCLGIKMFRNKELVTTQSCRKESTLLKCFTEGFLVSMSNPKAIVFFMSIFPQFIDVNKEYTPQFILLAITFSLLVIVVHSAYAISASFARSKLSSQRGSSILNKMSGSIFISFGFGLALSSK